MQTLKTLALSGAIVLGFLAQSTTAKADVVETLTVAGGCFWCVEADFEKVKGVKGAVSGFAGGKTKNPTYKQVTGGNTGHYEAVQITFDPSVVSRDTILSLFFRSVGPTDAGGQFCDCGPSYRTAIFAAGPQQKAAAEKAKAQAQADLGKKVVTPVLGAATFYAADASHQDYYKSNKRLAVSSVGVNVKKSVAYKRYRKNCGRDATVKKLWGSAAPFAG